MTPVRIVYWSSATRNTEKFVGKLGLPSIAIPNSVADMPVMTEPFVLVTPTFADGEGRGAVPKPVKTFLNVPENRQLMTGVIGSGNRNFGEHFARGAIEISKRCGVPVLWRFELAGDSRDVETVLGGLDKLYPDDDILARREREAEPCP